MKLYEKSEDLRIYAIVEISARGKMGIVMTGTSRQSIKGALTRMMIARTARRTQLVLATFAVLPGVKAE